METLGYAHPKPKPRRRRPPTAPEMLYLLGALGSLFCIGPTLLVAKLNNFNETAGVILLIAWHTLHLYAIGRDQYRTSAWRLMIAGLLSTVVPFLCCYALAWIQGARPTGW